MARRTVATRHGNQRQSVAISALLKIWPGAFALLGIAFFFFLQLASPLRELEHFPGNRNSFARGRLVVEMVTAAVVAPDLVAESWIGGQGSTWLIDRLPVAGTAAGILAVAGILGWQFLALAGADRHLDHLERTIFSCGVGLHIISLVTLGIGLTGWLRGARWPCFIIGGLLIGWAIVWMVRSHESSPRPRQLPTTSEASPFGLSWLWLIAPLVAVVLLGGMLPPIDFDVREYHLQVPKEFFTQGRIAFLAHNVYGNMPLGGSMFALLGMVLLDDWWLGALVGKTILATNAPLTAVALLAAGRRFAGTSAGMVAALVYLSIPWVLRVANLGLNEGALGFYSWLAIYSFAVWRQTSANRYLALSGFLAGAAIGVKYTAILFVAFPLMAAVLWIGASSIWRDHSHGHKSPMDNGAGCRRDTRLHKVSDARPEYTRSQGIHPSTWKLVLLLALVTSASGGSWLVKNAISTGNPIYPLLNSFFHGNARTDAMDSQWSAAHRPAGFSLDRSASDLANITWRSLWQSPLVVPLALLALAMRRFRSLAGPWWIYTLVYLACWWLSTHRIERFWVPLLPVLAMLAGLGSSWSIGRCWIRGLQTILVGWVLIAVVLAVSPQMLCGYTRFLASYSWLRDAEERVPHWRRQVQQSAPEGTAVLSVGDAEVFDLEVPVYYNTVFDEWLLNAWMGPSPWESQVDRLRTEFARRKISRVYVHWGELDRYRKTYDKPWGRSQFITPEWFERLVRAGLLQNMAISGEHVPVSLFAVIHPKE
ncbi:MAG: glycosyltransferase family 39 protein [Pirellulales bacterium]|nr:glycosyltransferase family 39 protein [Pirellulales bacterium]